MRLLKWSLLIVGLGAFLAADLREIATREELFVPDAGLLGSVAPPGAALARRSGPYGPYYSDRDPAAGRAHALAFLTDQVEPRIRGYSGEISLIVGVDDSGRVSGVRLLEHSETPSYMRSVITSGFLDKLRGRKLGAEIAGVDAVTGATITSVAIRDDILQSGALLCREEMGIAVEGVRPPRGFAGALSDPRSVAVLGAMTLAVFAFLARPLRWARSLSLAAGFAVVGIYCNVPLSAAHFTNLASMRFPSSSDAPLILLLAFVFVTGIVFRSRLYCDYLCPFGAVQEAAHAVSRTKRTVSERTWKKSTPLRYFLLFAIALLVTAGGYRAVGAMEPYVFLFNPGGELLPWLYVVVVVGAAFFIRRFWCRIFCPCGVCVELLASIGRRRNRQ